MIEEAKVLIADDDDDFRELLRGYLSDEGYRTVEAKDGSEVLNKIIDEKPDIVLLDVMMPSKNGFDVCRDIKNDRRTRGSAVVMLTVKNSLTDKLSGYVVGAQRYLCKPCEMEEIKDCLQSVLKRKRMNDIQIDRDV